jgi:hypothetical protein
MTQVAKRRNKAEGKIVPAAFGDRFAAVKITAVLRLRRSASAYAQDDK